MLDLCLIIVTVDVDVKFDFLQFLGSGILALRLQIFFLLILKLAEIHDADHRRRGTVRYQNQVQAGTLRQLTRLRQRHHIPLFAGPIRRT